MSMRKCAVLFTTLMVMMTALLSSYGVSAENMMVHASHILVDTEAEADAIHAELKEAKNLFKSFAVLAKEKSKCPSAKKGGDLGDFGRGQMVPEFDKVAFEGEPAKVYKTKTQFGWHLILISSRWDADTVVEDPYREWKRLAATAMPFLGPIVLILIMAWGSKSANKGGGIRARASHILVSNEAEADALLKQVTEAKDPAKKLAELAKTKSTCPSGRKGGDLGHFGRGQMVPEFDKAVFEGNVGEVQKVKTQFGYHILICTDRSDFSKKTN